MLLPPAEPLLPEPVLPAPDGLLLLPAPELEPLPELPMPLLLGELAPLPDVPPVLAPLPLEPLLLPLVIFSSCRHFSRSVPVMPRHLLLLAPDEAAPVLPDALGVELVLPAALGVELELPDALGVELELLPDAPEAPEAPPEALSEELLPLLLGLLVAPALEPVLPLAPPDEEPELCAIDTLARANNAAAVAALMSFRFIRSLPPYLLEPDPLLLPEPMPDPLLPAPELEPLLPGVLVLLPLPDAPLELGLLEPLVPPADAPEPDLLKY